jgi:cytochrome c oxidase subunit 2
MFQKPANLNMFHITELHHTIMFWLIIIFIHVCWMLFISLWIFREKLKSILKTFKADRDINGNVELYKENEFTSYFVNLKNIIAINSTYTHKTSIELLLIVVPSFILSLIIYPSLELLYFLDDPFYMDNETLVIKVTGHQWYWSYESLHYDVTNKKYVETAYDSYMDTGETNIAIEDFMKIYKDRPFTRLLSVDKPLILPTNVKIQILVTSTDVIHSWAVPALGIKVDAVPGRLNQVTFIILKEGIYFGQCSELCGVNHSYMPIEIIALPMRQN